MTGPDQRPGEARRRRPYGAGSLLVHRGRWYGQWRVGGRIVKRKLGERRVPGTRQGLTRRQAEAQLRRLMQEVVSAPAVERMSVEELGDRYLRHLELVRGRKPSTISDYRSILRRHVATYFGSRELDRITDDDLVAYSTLKLAERLAPKTVTNHLNFLHGLFAFALKRRHVATNPVVGIERPREPETDSEIRYLEPSEVEALIQAVPDDLLGETDRALYLTAAMTGLRQGELHALRWRDVDWAAGLIRVRRSITRGVIGTPKSRRGSRAVPMTDRVSTALRTHFGHSRYRGNEDLVFCHPHTGGLYDVSKARKRFKAALRTAGIRPIRFHDLRHTFGTAMARVGVPMRTLQELLGHRDIQTTLIYADYAPRPERERAWAELAFEGPGEPTGSR